MTMKLARWCVIYGLGVSIAMGIINVIYGETFEWSMVVFGIIFSIGVHFYLERIVEPQLQQKQAELEAADAEEHDKPKRRRRPKLKKK